MAGERWAGWSPSPPPAGRGRGPAVGFGGGRRGCREATGRVSRRKTRGRKVVLDSFSAESMSCDADRTARQF
uniref:Uncharacterized protein n=1 Tax=Oryza glumipatula TaxID=40148 RepID=A0A0E0BAR4_9ORYZ